MTKQYYKNLAITFFISTVWCIYVFFDYYTDQSFLSGLTLMFDFFSSSIFIIGLSIINIFLRFYFFRNLKIKRNFFYIFSGFSNILLPIIYLIYIVISNNIKEFFSSFEITTFYICLNIIFGFIILFDLHKSILIKKKLNTE